MRDRLVMGGAGTTSGGEEFAAAVMTLLEASGGYTPAPGQRTTARLPFRSPAGRSLVIMSHPMMEQAIARKLAVDNRLITLDLDAPGVEQSSEEPVGA
ncbi:hypothetical protein M1E17_09865 [Arthrobacter sp. D1-29]